MCHADATTFEMRGVRKNARQGFNPLSAPGIAVTVQRCRRCGHVFPNPMPIPATLSQHYNVPVEQYWKDGVDDDLRWFDQQIRTYDELSRPRGRGRALDVGAGIGRTMAALNRAGFDAWGIEPSESFLHAARERLGAVDRLVQSTVEDADFAPDQFVFVTFGAVLEHLIDPGRALLRAFEWLRPGGLLHAEVPNARWLISRIGNVLYRLRGTSFVANLSPMHPPYHLHEFTPNSFRLFAKQRGIEVAQLKVHACEPYYVPSLLKPLATGIMNATRTGMQIVVWLRK